MCVSMVDLPSKTGTIRGTIMGTNGMLVLLLVPAGRRRKFMRRAFVYFCCETSHLLDVPGHTQTGKWCPEEDSNLHALASAST